MTGLRTEGDVQYVFHDLPGLLDPEYALQERMRALALEGVSGPTSSSTSIPAPEAPAPDFVTGGRTGTRPRGAGAHRLHQGRPALADLARGALRRRPGRLGRHRGRDRPSCSPRSRRCCPSAEFAYPADDLGVQPMRFFAVEYLREAAFMHLEDELPYAFTAEIEEFRETTDPVYIRATLFVERETQKGILIGEGGRP